MMEVKTTKNPAQFLSWWQQITASLYIDNELAIKHGEGFDPVFFQSGMIVLSDGKISGCIAVFDNPGLMYHGLGAAAVGKFECTEDPELSHLLIQSTINEAIESDKQYIIGPLDGSTWDAYRYPLPSPKPMMFTEGVYKPWYIESFVREGFETIGEYLTQLDTTLEIDYEKNRRAKQYIAGKQVTFRTIDIDRYEEELVAVWEFCMESFKHNFLFTPIPLSSFIEKYLKSKPYVNPNYVLFAEEKGRLVGLAFCLPDIFHSASKRIILKTLARLPGKEYAGLGNELTVGIYEQAKLDGITGIYHAFMHNANASKGMSEQFSGKEWRQYRLFGKTL